MYTVEKPIGQFASGETVYFTGLSYFPPQIESQGVQR